MANALRRIELASQPHRFSAVSAPSSVLGSRAPKSAARIALTEQATVIFDIRVGGAAAGVQVALPSSSSALTVP